MEEDFTVKINSFTAWNFSFFPKFIFPTVNWSVNNLWVIIEQTFTLTFLLVWSYCNFDVDFENGWSLR